MNNFLPQYFIADAKSEISKKIHKFQEEVKYQQELQSQILKKFYIHEWESEDYFYYRKITKIRIGKMTVFSDHKYKNIYDHIDNFRFLDLRKIEIPRGTILHSIINLPNISSLEFNHIIANDANIDTNFQIHHCHSKEIGLIKNFYEKFLINNEFKEVTITGYNEYFPYVFNEKIKWIL